MTELSICCICGEEADQQEVLNFGGESVCINCKDLYVQGLREGVPTDKNLSATCNGTKFTVVDTKSSKDTWTIVINNSKLTIANENGRNSGTIPREEHYKYFALSRSKTLNLLAVKKPFRKVINLDDDVSDAIDDWCGDSNEAWIKHELRGTYTNLMIGSALTFPFFMVVIMSMKTGKPIPLTAWSSGALGILLFGIAIAALIRPHRYVLLAGSAWWGLLALFNLAAVIRSPSIWAGFWLVFSVILASVRFQIYKKHARKTPSVNPAPSPTLSD